MTEKIRIATRKSALALWQAEHVAARLRAAHPAIDVELVGMSTRGDEIIDTPLASIGGKGLFIKELERGLLDGRADIAVHSMKDVPNDADFPDGLGLTAILDREDPRDAFVSNRYRHPDELPAGARVGTCSLRRRCQLAARYPDIDLIDLRGNVNTRLRRLDAGDFDAIILAAAGLKRLGFDARVSAVLEPDDSLPAIGQGAIGIECRLDDTALRDRLTVLDDPDTHVCVSAERAFNGRLRGSCQVPIAGFATLEDNDTLRLRGLVGVADGSRILAGELYGPAERGVALGLKLADTLFEQGAGEVLAAAGR